MAKPPLRWGERFGRWKVIGPNKEKKYHTWVLCVCGTVASVQDGALRGGLTIRCRYCGQQDRRFATMDGRKGKRKVVISCQA